MSNLCQLHLSLMGQGLPSCELVEVEFRLPIFQGSRRCVRGKTEGPLVSSGTFQWTRAVRAACTLFVLHKLSGNPDLKKTSRDEFLLAGEANSLAASLDYALSKQPLWLLDMFGVDSAGRTLTMRLFNRINPSRKRVGPVIIGVRDGVLGAGAVSIQFNEREIIDTQELQQIVRGWMCDEPQQRFSHNRDDAQIRGILIKNKNLDTSRDSLL